MPASNDLRSDPRFAPRARRALGDMFSAVSPRYDVLNAVLSLGQDRAWRYQLWAAVPEAARVVVDVCCGSGASLAGLRRPGRTLLGVDASGPMLNLAAERFARRLGRPGLVRCDAFQLPLGGASVDAITIAFGLRNLRPRVEALRELARVLKPSGVLAILEAAAPRPGPLAPFHRFYLGRLVPAFGLLSPQPQAYGYLARSILEFGDGADLGADCTAAGLRLDQERRVLFGATYLWVASREPAAGQRDTVQEPAVQFASGGAAAVARAAVPWTRRQREWQVWQSVLLVLNLALVGVLIAALATYHNFLSKSHFRSWLTAGGWIVLGVGLAFTAVRSLVILSRLRYPPEDL